MLDILLSEGAGPIIPDEYGHLPIYYYAERLGFLRVALFFYMCPDSDHQTLEWLQPIWTFHLIH